MFKISEATAIALHSMIYISHCNEELISLKPIAEQFEISEHHLSKVLQRLVKAGFLKSIKGPKGGFKILPDKTDATFWEIYETIEGKMKPSSCLFPARVSNCSDCIMGDFFKKASKDFCNYLKSKKISDFKEV